MWPSGLNRAGIGWAGADPETLHVWNDGWSLTVEGGAHRLVAESDDGRLAVDLRLEPVAPPVLHGDGGYSRKGSEPGNASHYYSLTRLPTDGPPPGRGRVVRSFRRELDGPRVRDQLPGAGAGRLGTGSRSSSTTARI